MNNFNENKIDKATRKNCLKCHKKGESTVRWQTIFDGNAKIESQSKLDRWLSGALNSWIQPNLDEWCDSRRKLQKRQKLELVKGSTKRRVWIARGLDERDLWILNEVSIAIRGC